MVKNINIFRLTILRIIHQIIMSILLFCAFYLILCTLKITFVENA